MTDTNMQKLAEKIQELPKVGDNIVGKVIGNERNTLYVDLSPFGTGIIFGREYLVIKDIIKNLPIGSEITARVLDLEGEDGYIELSLKEAKQAEVWIEAQEAMAEKRVLNLSITEANKGGLMINWQGLTGFLPASQLSAEHYPKVAGGDANRVTAELQKLVGQKLDVVIITANPQEGKLVFSEKAIDSKSTANRRHSKSSSSNVNMLEKYSIGQEVEVEVVGIVEFGLFVKLPEGDEGLIHISEISWSLINDLKSSFKIGDKVKAKIIEINKEKVSLSIKTLIENPWKAAAEKYKKDDVIKAVVIKISDHGALVSVEEGVYGLIHISEFKDLDDLKAQLKLGEVYEFKINTIDTDAEKMTLVLNK